MRQSLQVEGQKAAWLASCGDAGVPEGALGSPQREGESSAGRGLRDMTCLGFDCAFLLLRRRAAPWGRGRPCATAG